VTLLGAPFRVVLDACVLYPMPLCDTLLRLAAADLYQACWSEEILNEATRNLAAHGRASPEGAQLRKSKIAAAFPEAMVTDFAPLIAQMPNQAKDRHVAAVAVKAGAPVIVTFNLRDFAQLPDGIAAVHPDQFLEELYELDPPRVVDALRRQAAALRKPPQGIDELIGKLGSRGLPRFAATIGAAISER
jgi:predicted nucleic acid-binding protein